MNKIRISISAAILILLAGYMAAQSRLDIPVQDAIDEKTMPWTGGYNAPQFANIDFNRDGIQDMISFDRQGNILRTFVRLPASGRWIQVWDYEAFFPKLVDWVQVYDFDKDGVEDLFTSSSQDGVAGVTVYRGAFENDVWTFTLFKDRGSDFLLVPAGGGTTNLYVSWDDIPSITDIDNDGDVDILAFEPGGSFIAYFENKSVEMGWGTDSLRFELEDFCWGKILENDLTEEVYLSDNPDVCSDGNVTSEEPIVARHSGSTVSALDYDFDGDKDAWLGDISSRHLVFLLNGLNPEEAWITFQEPMFPAEDTIISIPYFVGAYFVELDDDPEPELLAAANSRALAEDRKSVWRYDDDLADGPFNYKFTEKGWLQNEMIDVGSHSRPAIADVNGDGLQDLIVGGYHFTEGASTRIPSLTLYKNKGSLTQPYFKFESDDYLAMSQFGGNPTFDFAPAFGDLNGDGSIDLVVGDQNGKLFFYKNFAAPGDSFVFAAPVYPYMNINVGVSATPQIADINSDGLADLIIGERTGNSDVNGRCSNLNYFQNIGSIGSPLFNSDVNASPNTGCYGRILFDIPIGLPQYSTPTIANTKDGLILMTGSEPGKLHIYRDLISGITGSLTPIVLEYGGIDVGNRSAPVMADMNDDGKFELFAGNQRGGLELFTTEIEEGKTSINDPVISEKPYIIYHDLNNQLVEIVWKKDAGQSFLFDTYGRLLDDRFTPDIHRYQLNSYSGGIYFIQVRSGNRVWVEKIIKL